MKVYITYDRYERNEWFNVFHISLDREESIKHCKEVDLVDFISYGPDDCHSFQLQEVEMTQEQYDQLMKWYTDDSSTLEDMGDESSDYYKFMCKVFDKVGLVGHEDEILISTDGCTDNVEIVYFYGKEQGLDIDEDDDEYYELEEELFDNEDLYTEVLKRYINETY
jgi:hypothetical protein